MLLELSAGADLFVCEAYFFDKRVPYHLDFRTLWSRRASMGCRRIVLTHMSDEGIGPDPYLQDRCL